MPEAAQTLETILALMKSHTDRHEERRILDLLEASTAADLCWILGQLDLSALVADMDDRVFGPDHREALFDLLCGRRLPDLDAAARAAFVSALQRGHTSSRAERAIRDIFLGTSGAALGDLKAALDATASYRDLHQLVYHDIDDGDVRAAILRHIAEQAAGATGAPIKILSDIDDTLYANWKDERYPPSTVYPGVLALYRELDRGAGPTPDRAGDLTFVTARPGDRAGLIESTTREMLKARGLGVSTVLSGSFRRLLGNRQIAEQKRENFEEYRRLYPEYGFVFIGDSGQGDIAFGEAMIASAPDAVRAVLIHDVVSTPEAERARHRERGVHLFDTYVGAARFARDKGLFAEGALERIVEAALSDFDAVPFTSEAQREARRAELDRDICLARES